MTRSPMAPPAVRTRPADRRRPVTPLPRAEPWSLAPSPPQGPAVVALGGGHGLAVALAGVRRYAGSITAVVSVADDGGSSGRLRKVHGVPAPGDLRKCLVALAASDTIWREAFEHRFSGGELDGHALGNLVIVGLAQTLGDFGRALEEAGRLLNCAGRVLPATTDPVVLQAEAGDGGSAPVEGQVAVANSPEPIRRVHIVPEDAKAHPEAVSAIELADQVVLAPGSLFTSLVPVVCVPALREAMAAARGRIVHVCNLRPQIPETLGLDATDHLRAVLDHGARVDTFLYQEGGLEANEPVIEALGIEPVAADLAAPSGLVHDPARLAKALEALV